MICSFDVANVQHRRHLRLIRMSVRTKSFNSNKVLMLFSTLLFPINSSKQLSSIKVNVDSDMFQFEQCALSLLCDDRIETSGVFQLGGVPQFARYIECRLFFSSSEEENLWTFYAVELACTSSFCT